MSTLAVITNVGNVFGTDLVSEGVFGREEHACRLDQVRGGARLQSWL